jgi:hypothetical protein
VGKVRELISGRKIFGKVFVYEGMDYIKVVTHEIRQLKTMLNIYGFDINDNQSIKL